MDFETEEAIISMDDEELVILFHPEGGRQKKGAFTEGDTSFEYEKTSDLKLHVFSDNIKYRKTWGSEKEYFEGFHCLGFVKETHIEPYYLSILGQKTKYQTVKIDIIKGYDNKIIIYPFSTFDSVDEIIDVNFTFVVSLDQNSFIEFKEEIKFRPNSRIHLNINFDDFPGVYTTQSPRATNGKILKFLKNKNNVSNYQEIHNDFHDMKMKYNGNTMPFTLDIVDNGS